MNTNYVLNNESSSIETQIKYEADESKEVKSEFIDALKKTENDIVGSENIGSSIEFYDEDGSILLLTTFDETGHNVNFHFTLTDQYFDMPVSNIPDVFSSGS